MLNKANFDIAKLAAKENRYSSSTINGLYVSPKETIATDGHCLVRVATPDMPEDQFPMTEGITPVHDFTPFIMTADAAALISSAIPKKNTLPILKHAVISSETDVNGTAVFAVNNLTSQQVFRPNKIEGRFPNADLVTPDLGKATLRIGFDLTLLSKVISQLEKIAREVRDRNGSGNKLAVFSFTDHTSQLRIDFKTEDQQDVTAVIMPCKF